MTIIVVPKNLSQDMQTADIERSKVSYGSPGTANNAGITPYNMFYLLKCQFRGWETFYFE